MRRNLAGVGAFAKAVVPAAASLIVALVNMAAAGQFDTASIVTLATGLGASVVTYFVPNSPPVPNTPAE